MVITIRNWAYFSPEILAEFETRKFGDFMSAKNDVLILWRQGYGPRDIAKLAGVEYRIVCKTIRDDEDRVLRQTYKNYKKNYTGEE